MVLNFQGVDSGGRLKEFDLYVKIDEKWSEAIPGTGGSHFITKEKAGLYTSDEAYKMATTDALSVAMKTLGVAADVYMGLWDGSKYNKTSDEAREQFISVMTEKINGMDSKRNKIMMSSI